MENEYLKAFNKEFGFNLELKEGENGEIEGNPSVMVGEMTGISEHKYFAEQFEIIPFEDNELKDICGEKHKTIKYQLIGFKYDSGSRWEPPSCDDYVIDNYPSFGAALDKVMQMCLLDKYNNLIQSISEAEMAKNEKDLEDWNENN